VTTRATPLTLLELRKPIDVWNAILGRCGSAFPLAAKGVSARIEQTRPPEGACTAALTACGATRAVVVFDSYPFQELYEANIEATDLDVLPPELRDVLVEGMISTLWSVVPKTGVLTCEVLRIGNWRECAEDIGEPLDWFSISIAGLAPRPASIRVGCIAVDVARLLTTGRIAPWPRGRRFPAL
jgi:hypothetical protein